MRKPIIGIVGRENMLNQDERKVMSTDDTYRRAIVKTRWNSIYNITGTSL